MAPETMIELILLKDRKHLGVKGDLIKVFTQERAEYLVTSGTAKYKTAHKEEDTKEDTKEEQKPAESKRRYTKKSDEETI